MSWDMFKRIYHEPIISIYFKVQFHIYVTSTHFLIVSFQNVSGK
jgi:hypothetical protein